MSRRIKKVQARYRVSGHCYPRQATVVPALDIAGQWFAKAGFAPGDLVGITVAEGVITIQKA